MKLDFIKSNNKVLISRLIYGGIFFSVVFIYCLFGSFFTGLDNYPLWSEIIYLVMTSIFAIIMMWEIMHLFKWEKIQPTDHHSTSKWKIIRFVKKIFQSPAEFYVWWAFFAILLLGWVWFPLNANGFGPWIDHMDWWQGYFPLVVFAFIFVAALAPLIFKKDWVWSYSFLVFIAIIFLGIALQGFNFFMIQKSSISDWSTIILVFLIVFAADTFAYIGGTWYGKTLLAPKISPKKTWEGAVTGGVAAIVVGVIFCAIFYESGVAIPFQFILTTDHLRSLRYLIFVLISILIAITSVLGDLAFSWTKRRLNRKDFSHLLGAHGGILDRFDSLSLAMIMVWIIYGFTLI